MTNWDETDNPYDQYIESSSDYLTGEEEQVRVKFFTNERSVRLCFLKNQRYSLPIRLLNCLIKVLPCILYIIQVINDDPMSTKGCCHICKNHSLTPHDVHSNDMDITNIHWDRLIFVNRGVGLWITQIVCSMLSLLQMIITGILTQRGHLRRCSFVVDVFLELIHSIPFIISIFFPKTLRCLFIPSFLSCWLVKTQVENVLGDINRVFQRTPPIVFHRVMKVISSTSCLVFTSVCGIQHLQRGGYKHLSLFESLWLVVVTFSTVGYGDYKPDIWLSQLFMIIIMVVALIVIPMKLKRLASVWLEKHKLGSSYSQYRSKREKHVVLCTTSINSDIVMDFLNEFYAHKTLEKYYVCLLCPAEADTTIKIILQMPVWNQRVFYIQGSALKDFDLVRCRMQDSKACFILAPNNYKDSNEADQHTILRAWAIKDFAPQCSQMIQLYRPENKIHVKFAEHVICLDEFKYALFGNNVLIPGVSTLVTLLIHTSQGREGQMSPECWQRLYGKCSGNEIYNIKLSDSKYFKEYEGRMFSYSSYKAYRKYGVNLIAVSPAQTGRILLNPGSQYNMDKDDICFYLSLTEEENSLVVANDRKVSPDVSKRPRNKRPSLVNTDVIVRQYESSSPICFKRFTFRDREQSLDGSDNSNTSSNIIDYPRTLPYLGTSSCRCHLLQTKRPRCCLRLAMPCDHCSYTSAQDYKWNCNCVVACANNDHSGLYNFIITLRSHWISIAKIRPIILLIKEQPGESFLDSISYFPMVYWMLGSYENVDNLLKAGIILADKVVVVNKEGNKCFDEDSMPGCNTILAVQQIYSLFPHIDLITEISQSSNMKFALFSPDDIYALGISKMEKKERSRGSHISYMFRPPFAAGNVFSTNMLDTLLYQVFVKDYINEFLRLFLGIEQLKGSGHLSSYAINEVDLTDIKTYGALYKKLITDAYQIPIGIYRTIETDSTRVNKTKDSINANNVDSSNRKYNEIPDISEVIKNRMVSLNIPINDYMHKDMKSHRTSCVIINPSYEEALQRDDIIYLISEPAESNSQPFARQKSSIRSSVKYNESKFPSKSFLMDRFTEKTPENQSLGLKNIFLSQTSFGSSVEKEDPGDDRMPLMTVPENGVTQSTV